MFKSVETTCESGGIGRRARLRGVCLHVRVQVPSLAPLRYIIVPLFLFSKRKFIQGLEPLLRFFAEKML